MAKISVLLLGRIDLRIEVPAVKDKELASKESGENSERVRDRVIKARKVQARRFKGRKGFLAKGDMQSKELRVFCKLDSAGEGLQKMATTKLDLPARAYARILKVGRVIGAMADNPEIRSEHIGEAIQCRSLDRDLI